MEIIYKNGQPYGIRDKGGYLLFFPKVRKWPNQEKRYLTELEESFSLANKIFELLKKENDGNRI